MRLETGNSYPQKRLAETLLEDGVAKEAPRRSVKRTVAVAVDVTDWWTKGSTLSLAGMRTSAHSVTGSVPTAIRSPSNLQDLYYVFPMPWRVVDLCLR